MLGGFSTVQLFVTPWTLPSRLLCPYNSPGKNTGMLSGHLPKGAYCEICTKSTFIQVRKIQMLWGLKLV